MIAVLYPLLKFGAYAGWCYVGIRAFRPGKDSPFNAALGLGFLRLLMGLFFGAGIFLGGTLVAAAFESQVAAYLLVYVPVRWVEWAIIDALIGGRPFTWRGFWLGWGAPSRGWRARGIVVSCLADIPMIVSLGGNLPLGRFMC